MIYLILSGDDEHVSVDAVFEGPDAESLSDLQVAWAGGISDERLLELGEYSGNGGFIDWLAAQPGWRTRRFAYYTTGTAGKTWQVSRRYEELVSRFGKEPSGGMQCPTATGSRPHSWEPRLIEGKRRWVCSRCATQRKVLVEKVILVEED